MREATDKKKSPMASDRAKPRMAKKKNCYLRDGFLEYK